MTLAVLLSGQGAQGPSMFDLTANLPSARPVFDAAARLLDADPRALVYRPGADLHGNQTGQILCVTAALAGWRLISDIVPDRAIVAGYSIGDLAAWGVAGDMSPAALLELVARRAEAMDRAAGPDQGLAGLRGLPLARIAALSARHDSHLAIVNAPDSAVVGGRRGDLSALCAAALEAGAARARLLDVRVASHTPLLTPATEALRPVFRAALSGRRVSAGPRLVSGLDGAPVFSASDGTEKLARQVSETIDWAACMAACDEFGATAYLELGPGHALARIAEAAGPARNIRALEEFRSPDGLRAWVAGTGR